MLYENYACGGVGNYNGYCNPEIDKLIDRQSIEAGPGKAPAARLGDRAAAGRGRRPAADLFQPRRHLLGPKVKNLTVMVNSIYNGWRMEDVWLDK